MDIPYLALTSVGHTPPGSPQGVNPGVLRHWHFGINSQKSPNPQTLVQKKLFPLSMVSYACNPGPEETENLLGL